METRANYATIGLFTLLVIAMGFGFVYWLKRFDEAGARSDLRIVFSGTVSGLASSNSVYFNGIKVGVVKSLGISPDDPDKIVVIASISDTTPVKSDTRAEVNFNFLTGVAYVELFGGSADKPNLLGGPDIATLQGSPSSLTDVLAGAGRVVSEVEESIQRINALVEEVTPSVASSIQNVESFTAALSQNASGVNQFLSNVAEMSNTVGTLSEKLEAIVDRADATIAAINADAVRETIANAQEFMQRLNNAASNIEPIMTDIRGVTEEIGQFSTRIDTTLGKLDNIMSAVDPEKIQTTIDGISSFAGALNGKAADFDQIIADAKTTVENVNKFTANIQSHSGDIDTIIAQAKQLTERVNAASTRLDGLLQKADNFLGSDGGQDFFSEAAAAARSIREITDTFNQRAKEIADGLANFSGRGLDNVQALVDELRTSAVRINRAVSVIERDPSSFIFGGGSQIRDYNRR